MSNPLTRRVGLTFGPLFLETLVKHYFARVVSRDGSKAAVPLRRDALLYDATFNIVKDFMDAATRHTVEELQSLLNVRTPSPPWVHVVRLVIPTVSCDEAAVYLIKAFGGEDVMKRVVGGTKWWQVRGVKGVNAEWITAKKDWQNAQRRAKERQDPAPKDHTPERPEPVLNDVVLEPLLKLEDETGHPLAAPNSKEASTDSAEYQPEMDEMRCILYAHGGGYYFGSVDQERYSIQRFARKIHGRVLAVNYRLAPQYPFPCALQDLLAAYIFLIRPPEGAAHRPVRPEHIVVAGDSAGGGLSLALLQVIRESGLPAPAGGVLISPWCDLTHSFPSILTNTETDVIPTTGLSLHKPSPLWPPPSNDMSCKVRSEPRKSIDGELRRRSEGAGEAPQASDLENVVSESLPTPMNVGSTAVPDSIVLRTADGEVIEVAEQVQLYAPNALLKHPLVSPALSHLGGLPPLFFIAGDKEVLRDEIIYAAHRAAHPERFPVCDEVKDMYPALKHVENHMRPTPVHLQVYDDAAHILPVLFPFTTPSKYCYRAIAQFFKHVTDAHPAPPLVADLNSSTSPAPLSPENEIPTTLQVPSTRSLSLRVQRAASSVKRRGSLWSPSAPGNGEPLNSVSEHVTQHASDVSIDVAGPRIGGIPESHAEDVPRAGEARVYADAWAKSTAMIRERVSTQGIIHPLEPEHELPAMQLPPEQVGTTSEHAIRRYVAGTARTNKKFARAIRHIEKHRRRNIERASREQQLATLDPDERPPPSSIVARRDIAEALELARGTDKPPPASCESEQAVTASASNFWSGVVGFLTVSPEEQSKVRGDRVHVVGVRTGRTARMGSFLGRNRRSAGGVN